jgi:hypothetical protein
MVNVTGVIAYRGVIGIPISHPSNLCSRGYRLMIRLPSAVPVEHPAAFSAAEVAIASGSGSFF